MTTQQISGITPPLERDRAGIRYLRDVRIELIISETVTQSLPEPSALAQYLRSRFPDDSDTPTTTSNILRKATFRELFIEFDVPANADDKNDAVIVKIYNVSRQKAIQLFPIQGQRDIIMRIWAGYNNNPNIIFTGTVTKASIAVERPNSVLRFEASQFNILRSTPYNVRYPLPVSSGVPRRRSTLVREIIATANEFKDIRLDIHPNALTRINTAEDRGINGFTHEGMCADALTVLLDPIGMNWFVHNGVFNVISKRNFDRFDTDPIIISERSGMIDTPTLTEDGLDVRMLLTPTFIPGQNVVVHSRYLSDIVPETKPFRIAKVSHRGNNWAGDMVTQLSLQDFDKIGNTTDLDNVPVDLPVILPEEL